MRVAVVSIRSPEAGGEAAERMRRTSRLLGQRGHDVTVFCSQWWGHPDYEHEEGNVRYRAVTEDATARWLFAMALPFLLLRYSPAVIHVVASPPEQVIGAKLAGVLTRTPVIADFYGDDFHNGSRRTWQWAVNWPDRVIAPSRVVETWARELGAPEESTLVIPESVDMSLVRNLPTFGNTDVVYSRRLDADANLETVLLALAELRERDWRATVIGDGPEREAYERQARDLRIADRVTFVGDQPLEDRIARYKGAHVFVQTARRESFARELLWGLAAGCVGVVEYQAQSSAHELIEHRERGIRTTDDEELSEAIVSAGKMPELDVNEEFADYDQDIVIERVIDCYRRVRDEFGMF